MEMQTPPPPDDELPPPPSDSEAEKPKFPPIKARKPSPMLILRSAGAIFEKDFRTMAKHGFIGAMILVIFLGIVFYILSFAVLQTMQMNLNGDEGKNQGPGPLPGTTDRVAPTASMSIGTSPIEANTTIRLDASASTDNDALIYYVWDFEDQGRDIELYGRSVYYNFAAVGDYRISLTVVDASWNTDRCNDTLVVNPRGNDTEAPVAWAGFIQDVAIGTLATLNSTGSTDNVGIVNYTWTFFEYDWKIEKVLYGPTPTYRFDNAWDYMINLVVRDAAGNVNQTGTEVHVHAISGNGIKPTVEIEAPRSANVGDTISLNARVTSQDGVIQSYIWFIKQNGTTVVRAGPNTTFKATDQGMYSVVLGARDEYGCVGSSETTIVVVPAGINADEISWEATPFRFDVPFNLLTYAYAVALLTSVVFIGGLFAKGITHEINKGTIKSLFYGPISVTNMIFAKVLYPIVLGPIFIFPVVLVSLSVFNHPVGQVLLITLVAYAMCVVTMVAAAYGSCMIYAVTKRLSIKPSVMSRLFLYLSLIGTFTVGTWTAYFADTWLATDSWSRMWGNMSSITTLSPFHQGGILLSNMLTGTTQTPDYLMLVIPAALIAGGVLASRKLYSDIFSRE